MKSSRIILAVAALSLLAAVAGVAKTTPAMASHGLSLRGTISAVDEKAKTLSVKDQKGAVVSLSWNEATKLNGSLKNGEMVHIRYMEKDGQKVATVISVPAATPAKAATTKPEVAKTPVKP